MESSARTSVPDITAHLDQLLVDNTIASRLQQIALHHPKRVYTELVQSLREIASPLMEKIISVLDPAGHILTQHSQMDIDESPDVSSGDTITATQIAQAVQSADHFSLPFCQIQLLQLFSRAEQKTSSEYAYRKLFAASLVDQVDRSPSLSSNVLLDLIEPLGDGVAGLVSQFGHYVVTYILPFHLLTSTQIGGLAQERLLSVLARPDANTQAMESSRDNQMLDEARARKYLGIIQKTASRLAPATRSQLGSSIAAKLWSIINSLRLIDGDTTSAITPHSILRHMSDVHLW